MNYSQTFLVAMMVLAFSAGSLHVPALASDETEETSGEAPTEGTDGEAQTASAAKAE